MNPIIEEDIQYMLSADFVDFTRFRGKTVLVTGAYGMLASYMIYPLIRLNENDPDFRCTILALGRSRDKMKKRFAEADGKPYFKMICTDVCDVRQIQGDVDFIIHAASPTNPRMYLKNPVAVMKPNVTGTLNLLDVAREKHSEGFLFISSGEVYGLLKKDVILESDKGFLDCTAPRSCYAESKRAGEELCTGYLEDYQVHARIVRPSHTYGPTMNLKTDGRVFADFVNDAVQGRNISVKSDGAATRAFIYLADAALGFFKVLLDGTDGEAYNVTNNDAICSMKELAGLVASFSPKKECRVIFSQPDKGYPENANRTAFVRSTAKLESLGWKCHYSLQEGFGRTVRSFLPKN